jgi:hypothetical protein
MTDQQNQCVGLLLRGNRGNCHGGMAKISTHRVLATPGAQVAWLINSSTLPAAPLLLSDMDSVS